MARGETGAAAWTPAKSHTSRKKRSNPGDCLRTVQINVRPWLKSESTTFCRRPDVSTGGAGKFFGRLKEKNIADSAEVEAELARAAIVPDRTSAKICSTMSFQFGPKIPVLLYEALLKEGIMLM